MKILINLKDDSLFTQLYKQTKEIKLIGKKRKVTPTDLSLAKW